MTSIPELFTHDHRACDEVFAALEQAVEAGDWALAQQRLDAFAVALERHFGVEETDLFPAFESATGITMGPTQVMRMEHAQMRELLADLRAAAAGQSLAEMRGLIETLLIMMQQHNMKEEGVLYPMCAQHIPAQPVLLDRLQAALAA